MDNLTHSLAGWALGQAGLKDKTRKGLAALILGANMPDIDVFFRWAPWEPLATHRGFTHGFLGVLAMAPVLWGLLVLLDRWQVRRGTRFRSGLPMHRGWLLALCYLGALTHPLLDLQTTYSVQLFSPFSGTWWHSDSLFIIDIWLWLALGAAIWWSKRLEKRAARGWRRPVQAAIAIVLAYIAANLAVSQAAWRAVERARPEARMIFASPPPAMTWRRRMSWREGERVSFADYRPFGGGLGPADPLVPDRMDDPAVRAAVLADPDMRSFLQWSVLPVARVTRDGCIVTVLVADARYGLPGQGRARLDHATRLDLCASSRP